MATTEINYFVDQNGNYYINQNGDFYIANVTYSGDQTKLQYIKYKPYFYHNNGFKRYTAYIRKADGTYMQVTPHIYNIINIAVTGLAVAGVSRVSDGI